MYLDDLPTPCLVVDAHRLSRNLERMQQKAEANGVALRPHVKTHKSIAIARQQIDGGSNGITVAKVGEAETFVAAGFDDVRVAYEVVGETRYERLLDLMDEARVSFCVDTVDGARLASAFFKTAGKTAEILVEVDSGHHRCGVDPDSERAIETVKEIAALPGLRLAGILTHAGQGYHGPREGETLDEALVRASNQERDVMLGFAVRLREAEVPGVEPGAFEISIGSTPTMRHFENSERGGFRITEIRPGNYVFNDGIQVGIGVAEPQECALTILTTVISRHRDHSGSERLFVDAGKKILTGDTGYATDGHGILLYNPRVMEPMPHAHITGLSEEHGWIEVKGGSTLHVGDRIQLIPNHACTAMNTQNLFYVAEGEDVVDTLPVDARGRVF